jgi:hypothetical protein
MEGFDLKNYTGFYVFIKTLSGVFVVLGLLFLLDYYLPGFSREEIIVASKLSGVGAESQEYILNTGGIDFRVEIQYKAVELEKDLAITVSYSKVFGFIKDIKITDKSYLEIRTIFNNIFLGKAFFAKILLLSIFTLLNRRPRYWMIVMTLFNIPVIVVFTIVDQSIMQNVVLMGLLIAGSVFALLWYFKGKRTVEQ